MYTLYSPHSAVASLGVDPLNLPPPLPWETSPGGEPGLMSSAAAPSSNTADDVSPSADKGWTRCCGGQRVQPFAMPPHHQGRPTPMTDTDLAAAILQLLQDIQDDLQDMRDTLAADE